MKDKLKVLVKEVGKEPQVKYIENNLKAKQELVGGLIEVVNLNEFDDEVVLICNEEGKILEMPFNSMFNGDLIAGDYFLIGDDYENADFKSLTNKQIEKFTKILKERSFIYSPEQIKEFENDKNSMESFLNDYHEFLINSQEYNILDEEKE